MTATEQLRKLLDERGVEWACHGYENHTWWNGSGVFGWHAENRPSVNGLFVKLEAVCTPEQAIAATLGSDAKPCYATDYTHARCKYSANRGWTEDTKFYVPTLRMLTAEQVRECVQHVYYEGYNDGAVHRGHGIEETDFQAIADELNVTLGRGTCKLEETENYPSERGMVHVLECSNCGRECEHVNGDYEHCPHCLARNELF